MGGVWFLIPHSSVANWMDRFGRFLMRIPEVGVTNNRIIRSTRQSQFSLLQKEIGFGLDGSVSSISCRTERDLRKGETNSVGKMKLNLISVGKYVVHAIFASYGITLLGFFSRSIASE